MTEPLPMTQYIVSTEPVSERRVIRVDQDTIIGLAVQATCQNEDCRAPMGDYVAWRGEVYLDDGGPALAYAKHGVCKTCWHKYHFTSNDPLYKKLLRIARRVVEQSQVT